MINIDNNSKKDCCGCTACSSVCPKSCITMTEDNEGFFYPVVPKDQARIRVQLSAAHTREQLDQCITAFIKVAKQMKVID